MSVQCSNYAQSLRAHGNQLYAKALQLAPTLQLQALERACVAYRDSSEAAMAAAPHHAAQLSAAASALKNLAQARHRQLAALAATSPGGWPGVPLAQLRFYAADAYASHQRAIHTAMQQGSSHSDEWLHDLQTRWSSELIGATSALLAAADKTAKLDRLALLASFVDRTRVAAGSSAIFTALAYVHFQIGCECVETAHAAQQQQQQQKQQWRPSSARAGRDPLLQALQHFAEAEQWLLQARATSPLLVRVTPNSSVSAMDCDSDAAEWEAAAAAAELRFDSTPVQPSRPDGLTIGDLQTTLSRHIATCSSEQCRRVADERLRGLLFDEADLEFTVAWSIIDEYREAALRTRGIDVESEAMAMSSMGHVYASVLKLRDAAQRCYHQCMLLAHSLHPKVVTHEAWFQRARDYVAAFQASRQASEQQQQSDRHQPVLVELADVLAALRAQTLVGTQALLRHVYGQHPPKRADHVLGSLAPDDLKKTLVKAMAHYHPDRNSEAQYQLQWHVLANEIFKMLTAKYEMLK